MSGASARPMPRRRGLPQAQIGFCFRVDGLHANGLASYASDAKQFHNKQALGEAARVRGHELAQRLDVNFTLGQRVKLRRSEPINAALEFRA